MQRWAEETAALVIAGWCALSVVIGLGLGFGIRRSRRSRTAGVLALATHRLPWFVLHSDDVEAGAVLAPRHLGRAAGGGSLSPQLSWSGFPERTAGFALTCLDASTRGGWRWALVDLPASTTGLPTGAGDPAVGLLPAGVVTLTNDDGERCYGGPCPVVARIHRIVIVVYALDVEHLEITASTRAAALVRLLDRHVVAQAALLVRAVT